MSAFQGHSPCSLRALQSSWESLLGRSRHSGLRQRCCRLARLTAVNLSPDLSLMVETSARTCLTCSWVLVA